MGLDVIYNQAKKRDTTVGRPEIQKFAGALQGRRARKGIFITTGSFSKSAVDFPSRIDNRIVLIDGKKLVDLMIEVFETKDVSRLRVYYTADRLAGGTGRNHQFRLGGMIDQNGIDVTREFLEESEKYDVGKQFATNSKEVFIVHGHNSDAKWELVRMVENEFGLKAIILEEQPDLGRTIIEKFENVAELPGYAFVLLTPDDVGGENTLGIEIDASKTGNKRLKDLNINFKPRARQNVILELGYFYARLRRKRVCCLYKEGVEIPSDISGIIYKKFTKSIKEMEGDIRRELRAVGYDV